MNPVRWFPQKRRVISLGNSGILSLNIEQSGVVHRGSHKDEGLSTMAQQENIALLLDTAPDCDLCCSGYVSKRDCACVAKSQTAAPEMMPDSPPEAVLHSTPHPLL